MLRPVVFIIALVLFSAAASIAVAWSTTWLFASPVRHSLVAQFETPYEDDETQTWSCFRTSQGVAVTWITGWLMRNDRITTLPIQVEQPVAPYWSRLSDPTSIVPHEGRRQQIFSEAGRGWPLHCVREDFLFDHHADDDDISALAKWRPSTITIIGGPHILQRVSVIPAGLAANTAIYATALFLLFYVPRAAHRSFRTARRRRRNQCVACGYAREGLDTDAACPECGTTNK